jgi:hypothetical protein
LCEVGEGGLVVVVDDVALAVAVTADAADVDVVKDMVVVGTVAVDVVDVAAAAVTVIGGLAVFAAAVPAVATGTVDVADVCRTRGGGDGPGVSSSLSSVLSSRGVGVDLVWCLCLVWQYLFCFGSSLFFLVMALLLVD